VAKIRNEEVTPTCSAASVVQESDFPVSELHHGSTRWQCCYNENSHRSAPAETPATLCRQCEELSPLRQLHGIVWVGRDCSEVGWLVGVFMKEQVGVINWFCLWVWSFLLNLQWIWGLLSKAQRNELLTVVLG